MTENQKIWLEELVEEHRVAASNERLWSKGADDDEQARMHEENAEEHIEFANMLTTLGHLEFADMLTTLYKYIGD